MNGIIQPSLVIGEMSSVKTHAGQPDENIIPTNLQIKPQIFYIALVLLFLNQLDYFLAISSTKNT